MTREDERLEQAKNYNSKGSDDVHTAFLRGAEWADSTMIDRVCEYIEQYAPIDTMTECDNFIAELKEAMKGD